MTASMPPPAEAMDANESMRRFRAEWQAFRGLPDPDAMFAEIRRLSADKEGVTRPSYGVGETAALDFLAGIAHDHGITSTCDGAGNLVMTLEGAASDRRILVGSHLDSVPQGGNFDGMAGVVAGLLCLLRFRCSGRHPPRTISVLGLRGEESAWFNTPCLGSRALFGEVTAQDLASPRRDTGQSLRDYLNEMGAVIVAIEAGQPLLTTSSISGYYELHIEQGPVMVARDLPVAIVTGIRGNFRRSSVICRGEAGHSGAVPPELRHDAVAAVVELLHRMEAHWKALLAQGHDLVATTGVLHTDIQAHAASRIEGEVTFSYDARSQSKKTLSVVENLFDDECRRISAERGVAFFPGPVARTPPAVMDTELRDHLRATARRLGMNPHELPSGSGHDAAVFARHGVPAAMIFIRNRNGSHNPREAMDTDDFFCGANLLFHALAEHPLTRDVGVGGQ